MKSRSEKVVFVLNILLVLICANCYFLAKQHRWLIPVLFVVLILANIMPAYSKSKFPNAEVSFCHHGVKTLKVFCWTVAISSIFQVAIAFFLLPDQWLQWAGSLAVCACVQAIVFGNGTICTYCTSVQLGVKYRVLGILLGWTPIANLVMLGLIIKIAAAEVAFETEKFNINQARRDQQLCKTRHPLLLVHGVYFRDFKYMNYWGRIPKELIYNGASVFYGEHQSAASIKDSAAELTARIKHILQETGCEKLNIIAHSKGGLDCRYAISFMGIAPYVASLVTINTPHRGCEFVDFLLNKVPKRVLDGVEKTYNTALKKLGDPNPDFVAAAEDLGLETCMALDKTMILPDGIYCRSVGSKLNRATNGKFPFSFSHQFVKTFDGANDGVVGIESSRFGQEHQLLTVSGRHGISHGDVIDLNRRNIPEFDVREFYVQLVADLKQRGL